MKTALPRSTASVVEQHRLALSAFLLSAAVAVMASTARGEDAARYSLWSPTEPEIVYDFAANVTRTAASTPYVSLRYAAGSRSIVLQTD
jgi:hypothetical protein